MDWSNRGKRKWLPVCGRFEEDLNKGCVRFLSKDDGYTELCAIKEKFKKVNYRFIMSGANVQVLKKEP